MSDLISIVTLTHNKLEVTSRCLPTLLDASYPHWELVVVDNGSTDGTQAWLDDFAREAAAGHVRVRSHRNDANIGCSTARNQGFAMAKGKYVVFMDNDVALRSRTWLEELKRVLDDNARAGMAGPKLVYPFPPYCIQCAGVGISASGRVQFRGRGEARSHPEFNVAREVQCLISACVMFRREVLDACGGFDEAFNPVEFEDFDLCYNARQQGYTAHYVPGVEMYHFESVTTAGTETLPNTYLIIKNGMLFKKRWRHMFETENGPAEDATKWRSVESPPFEAIAELPAL